MPGPLSGVTQISAGSLHTCAVKGDGSVACWGQNANGQATVPAGLSGVAQVSAGGVHTCALKGNGTVACWGLDGYGEASVPAGLAGVIQVSAGFYHSCALRAVGSVLCWGYGGNGERGAGAAWTAAPVLADGVYGQPYAASVGATGSPAPRFAVTAGWLPEGLALDPVTGEVAGTPTRAGVARLSVGAGNPLEVVAERVAVTIAPAALTVTADDHEAVYGAPLPALGATYRGFVLGDAAASLAGSLACSVQGVAGSPHVGVHPIVCGGQTSANYAISYRAGTLTVGPAPLVVRARDAAVRVDEPLPVFGATGEGLVAGEPLDSLSGVLGCRAVGVSVPVRAGRYPIRCGGAASADYAITYVDGTLTVGALPRARRVSLTTRGIAVLSGPTRSLAASCRIDAPGIGDCAVRLTALVGGHKVTLARSRGVARVGAGLVALRIPISNRIRRLARRPGGVAATLTTSAHQRGYRAPLASSQPLLLLPTSVVDAPTDGLFASGSARLPAAGTAYLRTSAGSSPAPGRSPAPGTPTIAAPPPTTRPSGSPAPPPSAASSPTTPASTPPATASASAPPAPPTPPPRAAPATATSPSPSATSSPSACAGTGTPKGRSDVGQGGSFQSDDGTSAAAKRVRAGRRARAGRRTKAAKHAEAAARAAWRHPRRLHRRRRRPSSRETSPRYMKTPKPPRQPDRVRLLRYLLGRSCRRRGADRRGEPRLTVATSTATATGSRVSSNDTWSWRAGRRPGHERSGISTRTPAARDGCGALRPSGRGGNAAAA